MTRPQVGDFQVAIGASLMTMGTFVAVNNVGNHFRTYGRNIFYDLLAKPDRFVQTLMTFGALRQQMFLSLVDLFRCPAKFTAMSLFASRSLASFLSRWLLIGWDLCRWRRKNRRMVRRSLDLDFQLPDYLFVFANFGKRFLKQSMQFQEHGNGRSPRHSGKSVSLLHVSLRFLRSLNNHLN